MKLQQQILMVEFADLLKAGIPEGTLKAGAGRGSSQWPFVKDNEDKRKLLIPFEKLAERYRAMVRNVFGNPYEYVAAQILTPHIVCPPRDREIILSCEGLTHDQQIKYITACAYLKLIDCTKAQYRAYGFPGRPEFEAAVSALIIANKVCLPSHPKSLLKKLSEYRLMGARSVIHKTVGNTNAVKLGDPQKLFIKSLYADHRKPTVEMVHQLYLQKAKAEGWPALSRSTIKSFLATPAVRQQVQLERDPVAWKNQFGYTITTHKPTKPDALVEGDGTKLNLFYRNEDGKLMADIQMYVVIDIASEFILGCSFGRRENTETVQRAWRMAIQRSGRLPKQTRFDNGAAHKGKEMQRFMKYVSDIHFESTAYSGQSKYIEGILGRFQSQHLRLFHGFTGMNIKTKKNDSQLNQAWVKSNLHLIPNLENCIAQALQAMDAWNNGINGKGQVRADIYYNGESVGRPLLEQDRINIFYIDRSQPCKYWKDGLEMFHQNERLHFEVRDTNNIPDQKFLEQNIGERFNIKFNPSDLSHVFLFDNEGRLVAKAESTITMPGALTDHTEGTRTALNQRLDIKRRQVQNISALISEAKESQPAELSHEGTYKDALSRSEGDYLVHAIMESEPQPERKRTALKPAEKHESQTSSDHFIDPDFQNETFNSTDI